MRLFFGGNINNSDFPTGKEEEEMEAFLLVAGFIGMITSAMVGGANYENPFILYTSMKFFGGFIAIASAGGILAVRNEFCSKKTQVDKTAANIEVCNRQKSDLEGTLTKLLDKYIDHEKGLMDIVKGRSTEHLMALFERYPELKANDGITKLTEQLVKLRCEISGAEENYNRTAQEYNEQTLRFPMKHFRPSTLPDHIDYK